MSGARQNTKRGAALAPLFEYERTDTSDLERGAPCPRCGASTGRACRTPEGSERREAHFERVVAVMVELLRPVATPGPEYCGRVSTVERAYAVGRGALASVTKQEPR